MRFNIKKSDITASLVIIIVCVLLMIMLWLRTSNGDGTAPSYRFLADRNPAAYKEFNDQSHAVDRVSIYSFEADCNDLCSKAHAELTPDGFDVRTSVQILSGHELRERFYYLKERFPRGPVWIHIYDNRQYIDLHDLYNYIPKSNYALSEKDGWVVVTIVYGRGWRWPF